jgi:alpha-D-ribose 1-methylphosphonate 5-triphosphate diphosphatase
MASNNIMSWPEAVRLATLNPAKAVKIDHTTGSIEKNKNADLIIVDSIDDLPLVTHTIVKGKVITQCQIFNKTQQYAYSD